MHEAIKVHIKLVIYVVLSNLIADTLSDLMYYIGDECMFDGYMHS